MCNMYICILDDPSEMMYWGLLMPVMCWRSLLSEYPKCLISLWAAGKIGLNIREGSAMCGVDAL